MAGMLEASDLNLVIIKIQKVKKKLEFKIRLSKEPILATLALAS